MVPIWSLTARFAQGCSFRKIGRAEGGAYELKVRDFVVAHIDVVAWAGLLSVRTLNIDRSYPQALRQSMWSTKISIQATQHLRHKYPLPSHSPMQSCFNSNPQVKVHRRQATRPVIGPGNRSSIVDTVISRPTARRSSLLFVKLGNCIHIYVCRYPPHPGPESLSRTRFPKDSPPITPRHVTSRRDASPCPPLLICHRFRSLTDLPARVFGISCEQALTRCCRDSRARSGLAPFTTLSGLSLPLSR